MSEERKLEVSRVINSAFEQAAGLGQGIGVVALSLIMTPLVVVYALIVLPVKFVKRALFGAIYRRKAELDCKFFGDET